MGIPERYIYIAFHIDTNRINARQSLENMNILEEWCKNGVIRIEMSEPSMRESFSGNNISRKNKAADHIFSQTYAETPDEIEKLSVIEKILFPEGAKNQNQKNDVEIVFNASKYNCILITNDGGSKTQPGGILGNAERLKSDIGVTVVSDGQAIDIVRKGIEKRDGMARYIAKDRGIELPSWVGND